MTPKITSASGFHSSDSCAGAGDSDPFWGYGTEEGIASASTSRWGDVAVVQQDALESPLAQYSPGYDASPLSPSFLFKEFPSGIDWEAATPADIGQLLANEAGATSPPGDIHQLSVDKSAPSPEPARRLSRKRSRGAKQTEARAAPKKPTDRTVQIAGFSWTLPPDPGRGGPYPSLTFLIGAAIASSDSGTMKLAEIRQWIRARYPSRSVLANSSISCALCRSTDFVNIRAGKHYIGLWRLRDPQQLRSYYERDIYLRQRCGVIHRNRVLRCVSPAPEQDSPGAVFPALSVRFGSRILTLPPYSAGQEKPPIRLLCGCAIALGSEQGASVKEMTEWIAGRYSIQQANAIKALRKRIREEISARGSGFRRTSNPAPGRYQRGFVGMRWVLKNPADFAARYGGRICSQDS